MRAIIGSNAAPCSNGTAVATVPPSKSMAHRLLACSALADGPSHIANLSHSADIDATAAAIHLLGADIEWEGTNAAVRGYAPGRYRPEEPIDCGESGSTLRFLIPIFALLSEPVTFIGAKRLFERPLGPYEAIFRERGLLFDRGQTSLTIEGPLPSGDYTLRGDISSQFISGLLFALPLLEGDSTITIKPHFESGAYVTLTRWAQERFGIYNVWTGPFTLMVPGGQRYGPADLTVEGDWSQGAVFAVIATVRGGFSIAGLDAESAQGDRVILELLRKCGAQTTFCDTLNITPPKGGLRSPGVVDLSGCPDLGPVLFSLAALCRGTTRFVNAGRLRGKESDRIGTMERELKKLGVPAASTADSLVIEGGAPLKDGLTVDAHNDHRVAMALATLAICAGISLTIEGAECVEKSWPHFFDDLKALGADVALL